MTPTHQKGVRKRRNSLEIVLEIQYRDFPITYIFLLKLHLDKLLLMFALITISRYLSTSGISTGTVQAK